MNRPTEPFNPNDREPVPDRSNGPAPSDAWTDAIRALQTMARRHEPQDAPASPGFRAREPAAGVIAAERAAPAAPQVDETLAALQVLARRYSLESGQPPSPVADQEPAEPHLGSDQIAPEQSEFEPPASEFDDPTPSARMLQRKRPSWASLALILVSAAVLAVLLVGALSMWRQLFHAGDIRADAPPAASQDVAAPASCDRRRRGAADGQRRRRSAHDRKGDGRLRPGGGEEPRRPLFPDRAGGVADQGLSRRGHRCRSATSARR